jgi:asparagine synthase (glutamine-hydrolysing)
MLLAALSATGPRGAAEIVDALSLRLGPSNVAIFRDAARAVGWGASPGLVADERLGFLAEGWLELNATEIDASSLREASGAFAMVALKRDGIVLASGRAGGYRPIYVAWPTPELVIASTRIANLVALLPRRSPIDLEHLSASLLAPDLPATEATPYSAIRRVPQGEAWLVRPGAQPQRWSTIKPLLDRELADDDELPARVRAALSKATRRAARGAARMAVEISGGLDSSFVFSTLVSLGRAGEISAMPQAIAYDFDAPPWHDDRPHLRSLEAYLGVRANRLTPKDAAPFLREAMVVDASPALSPLLSAARAVGRIAGLHGVDVVLNGLGGDDLDGNPRHFAHLLRRGQIARALRGALRTRGVFYEGSIGRLDRFLLFPFAASFLPGRVVATLRRLRRRPPRWAGPRLVSRVKSLDPAKEPLAAIRESPDERYSVCLHRSAMDFFNSVCRQEEIVGGYALRTPFLDDDFLRFAARIPPLSLMRGGYLRGLMREAMRGLVPEELRLRRTKGSVYWFVEQIMNEAGGLEAFSSLADVSMLADLQLVEPRRFRTFFDSFARCPSDDATYDDLWRVLSIEAFLRNTTRSDDVARAAA